MNKEIKFIKQYKKVTGNELVIGDIYTYGYPEKDEHINRIVIDINKNTITTIRIDSKGTKSFIEQSIRKYENKRILHLLNLTKDGFEFIEIKEEGKQLVEIDNKQFYLVEK